MCWRKDKIGDKVIALASLYPILLCIYNLKENAIKILNQCQ